MIEKNVEKMIEANESILTINHNKTMKCVPHYGTQKLSDLMIELIGSNLFKKIERDREV